MCVHRDNDLRLLCFFNNHFLHSDTEINDFCLFLFYDCLTVFCLFNKKYINLYNGILTNNTKHTSHQAIFSSAGNKSNYIFVFFFLYLIKKKKIIKKILRHWENFFWSVFKHDDASDRVYQVVDLKIICFTHLIFF